MRLTRDSLRTNINQRWLDLETEYKELTGLEHDKRNGTAQVTCLDGHPQRPELREALAIHGEICALEQLAEDFGLFGL